MGNKCFHAPSSACHPLNSTMATAFNNCSGFGVMCEAVIPYVYLRKPNDDFHWNYNYSCTDQPKFMITAATVLLALAGLIIMFNCCLCRWYRNNICDSYLIYYVEIFFAFIFPIALFGGFTLLGVGFRPLNSGTKLYDIQDICSLLGQNYRYCYAFYCAYSSAGQRGVLAGVIIGFSILGCIYGPLLASRECIPRPDSHNDCTCRLHIGECCPHRRRQPSRRNVNRQPQPQTLDPFVETELVVASSRETAIAPSYDTNDQFSAPAYQPEKQGLPTDGPISTFPGYGAQPSAPEPQQQAYPPYPPAEAQLYPPAQAQLYPPAEPQLYPPAPVQQYPPVAGGEYPPPQLQFYAGQQGYPNEAPPGYGQSNA